MGEVNPLIIKRIFVCMEIIGVVRCGTVRVSGNTQYERYRKYLLIFLLLNLDIFGHVDGRKSLGFSRHVIIIVQYDIWPIDQTDYLHTNLVSGT